MKHNGIIAIVFIVGCATGGVAAQLVVPPVRAGTSPTRWEYQCVAGAGVHTEEVTATLNKLGAAGWELASLTPKETFAGGEGDITSYVLCAKRALP
jgi:hypothetical protein